MYKKVEPSELPSLFSNNKNVTQLTKCSYNLYLFIYLLLLYFYLFIYCILSILFLAYRCSQIQTVIFWHIPYFIFAPKHTKSAQIFFLIQKLQFLITFSFNAKDSSENVDKIGFFGINFRDSPQKVVMRKWFPWMSDNFELLSENQRIWFSEKGFP